MPVIIANNWNALREGIDTDAEGNKFFTGSIIITFWLDTKIPNIFTGDTTETESSKHAQGVIVQKQAKDENGKFVFDSKGKPVLKHYKVSFEHQVVVNKVTRVTSGFDGWSASLRDGTTVCLPKGRGLMKEVPVEPAPEETDEVKPVEKKKTDKKEEKPKTKMIRSQPDNVLSAIFTVK